MSVYRNATKVASVFLRNERRLASNMICRSLSAKTSTEQLGDMKGQHHLDRVDKFVLKNFGNYSSKEEIPTVVRPEEIDKAKSKARIFMTNWSMIGMFIVAGVLIAYSKFVNNGDIINNSIKKHEEWHNDKKSH